MFLSRNLFDTCGRGGGMSDSVGLLIAFVITVCSMMLYLGLSFLARNLDEIRNAIRSLK